MSELPVIQKTYDFIHWYIPILNRLPQSHKFTLGERITNQLYDLLEGLDKALALGFVPQPNLRFLRGFRSFVSQSAKY